MFFEALIVDWLQAEFDHEQRYELQRILSQLGQGDPVLSQICIEQLLTEPTTSARWLGAFLLGDVGTGAPSEIATLEQFLQTEPFKPVRRAAARSLAQLLAKQKNAQQQLSQWLDRSWLEEIDLWIAYQLGITVPHAKAKAIEHLVRLIATSPAFADEFLYSEQGVYNFTSIVRQSARQLSQLLSADCAEFVVARLSACLSEHIKQQEPERYRSAFELLWQCAYLLAPTQFLAAWSSGTGGR